MTVPTQKDIDKYLSKLEEFKKKCEDDGKPKPKVLLSMLRSIIRQVWMKAPNKLAFLLSMRKVDLDPNTKTKWLYTCKICNDDFKQSDIEVDHIKGNKECTDIAQLPEYIDDLLNVGTDDLQIACKECHSIKSYAEKHKMSFRDAGIEKQVIQWMKENNTGAQKEYLTLKGFEEGEISNTSKRRLAYRSLFNDPD